MYSKINCISYISCRLSLQYFLYMFTDSSENFILTDLASKGIRTYTHTYTYIENTRKMGTHFSSTCSLLRMINNFIQGVR